LETPSQFTNAENTADMTQRRIEELANEVAREIGTTFAGFKIDHVELLPDALAITFSWLAPFQATVHLRIRELDTDEDIKQEIRRQLEGT